MLSAALDLSLPTHLTPALSALLALLGLMLTCSGVVPDANPVTGSVFGLLQPAAENQLVRLQQDQRRLVDRGQIQRLLPPGGYEHLIAALERDCADGSTLPTIIANE